MRLTKNELVAQNAALAAQLHAAELRIAQLETAPVVVPADEAIEDIEREFERVEVPAGCEHCERCDGTGVYVRANGEEDKCYACRGKGFISPRDMRRNDTYALHRAYDVAFKGQPRWALLSEIPQDLRRGRKPVQHNGWWYLS